MNDNSHLDELIAAAARSTDQSAASDHEPRDDPKLYRCWHSVKKSREVGLVVQDKSGILDVLPYADFRRARMLPPNMGIIIFTHCYLTFQGDNLEPHLEPLAQLLKDQQACYIKAYNVGLFNPIGSDEPVIRELTILPRLKDDPIATLTEEIEGMT